MFQFFRTFLTSKWGLGVGLVFLGLIALAFASGDVANTGSFGGVAGGDRVATVGKERIGTAELGQAATNALENLKQENPRLSMKAFLADGGLDKVLDQMVDRLAISEFGRTHGVIASERLIDSEIAKMPAFRGPDGKFSESLFRQLLQQRGVSEAMIRDDLAQGLVARQILVPAAFGAAATREQAVRYAALLRESRKGAIALLPATVFAPAATPTDAEVAAYYKANTARFIRPERRVVRYATFSEDALKANVSPTEAEIAARYKADAAAYAPTEVRQVTQLVVPTEAAAKAILGEVTGGKSLEAAATAKGLATAKLPQVDKTALSAQTSQAVADAVFAAAQGQLATPARSGLGWHVMRVDAVVRKPGRTLDQARLEIAAALAVQKRRAALVDLSARIEESFDNGGNLADSAKELGLAIQQTAPLTADGRVYGKPAESAPPVLARVLQTAFSMEREGEPQLAEVEPGKTFVIFDVSDITASAPAPLAEIKADVTAALRLDRGATAARAAAERLMAEVRKGADLLAAAGKLGRPVPVDAIAMSREQLTTNGQVPPPLALLFSMAEGTVKILPAPGNQGWYVVALKDIVPGAVAANDPIIAAARRELGAVTGREYAESLRRAIRDEVAVKRNATAVQAVRNQLAGGN